MELMQEDTRRRASVDRISARSGVSKATTFEWWPNRTAPAQGKRRSNACSIVANERCRRFESCRGLSEVVSRLANLGLWLSPADTTSAGWSSQ
jgi:hypothetical protein